MKIIKSSFNPVDVRNKANFKPYYRIERDGTVVLRVLLDIPYPEIREHIIYQHYLSTIVRHYRQEDTAVTLISRDDPWDFKLRFNQEDPFNVEITSIADDTDHFTKIKKEERLSTKSVIDKIPLHELNKLNQFFPNPIADKRLKFWKSQGYGKNDLVANPYLSDPEAPLLFLSSALPNMVKLENLIKDAINKKMAKKHADKDTTVLIIDNRTTYYEISDFYTAQDKLENYLISLPFKEVWFYTGYCSDLSGKNAEFSFAPLKLTPEQESITEKLNRENPKDQNGVIYWTRPSKS